ncbi:hypothetical protein CTA1_13322 [Colletotrichum tanaceti]|uniref:Uncharacterized protein n=1 Tax=Colletotrichum tanaceti TaxID=1306861 RepID=A0A4U6X1S8_9PEZI|nr:hypothetical protein CTA1_13322 [Colletotrichum tanaceti]
MVLFLVSKALPPPPPKNPPSPLTSYISLVHLDPFRTASSREVLLKAPSNLVEVSFPNGRPQPPGFASEKQPFFARARATFFLPQFIFFHYARVAYLFRRQQIPENPFVSLSSLLNSCVSAPSAPYTSQKRLIEKLGFPPPPRHSVSSHVSKYFADLGGSKLSEVALQRSQIVKSSFSRLIPSTGKNLDQWGTAFSPETPENSAKTPAANMDSSSQIDQKTLEPTIISKTFDMKLLHNQASS